jgi:type IV pilus assembly protein PilA
MGLSDTNRRQARPQAPVAALRKLSDNKLPPLLARLITPDHAEWMPWSKPPLTTSTLRPQLQSALMRRLSKTSTSKKNALQQGFTLVELMIVIVIVGILSAIALPNFLSQSDKAKATEAKQQSASYLKQVYASYQEGGTTAAGAADGTGSIPCPLDGVADTDKFFDYSCDPSAASVTAVGTAKSGSLSGQEMTSSVDLSTGVITMGNLAAPAAP